MADEQDQPAVASEKTPKPKPKRKKNNRQRVPKEETANPRRDLFVQHYLKTWNATQSAIEAGYSKRTAKSIGQRLLTEVDIKAKIEAAKKDLTERLKLDQDFTLKKLVLLANSNLKKVAAWDAAELTITPSSQLSEDDAYMIESIKFTPVSVESVDEFDAVGRPKKYVEYKKEIKMRSPNQALDILADYQSLRIPKPEGPNEELAAAVREWNEELDDEKK